MVFVKQWTFCMSINTLDSHHQLIRTNAKYTIHHFRPDFHLLTYFLEITHKSINSVLVNVSEDHTVWIISVDYALEIFSRLNIWTCLQFRVLHCEMCFGQKWHLQLSTANESKIQGNSTHVWSYIFYVTYVSYLVHAFCK